MPISISSPGGVPASGLTFPDGTVQATAGVVGSGITQIVSLTQAEYDAIPVKSQTTLYLIT